MAVLRYYYLVVTFYFLVLTFSCYIQCKFYNACLNIIRLCIMALHASGHLMIIFLLVRWADGHYVPNNMTHNFSHLFHFRTQDRTIHFKKLKGTTSIFRININASSHRGWFMNYVLWVRFCIDFAWIVSDP